MESKSESDLITTEVAESIDRSVLCWLATVSEDGFPNVSPKEAFLHDGHGRILVANIASPTTVRNIRSHPRVCLSFVDVFFQKGFKIRGTAVVIDPGDAAFDKSKGRLLETIGTTFSILSVIEVTPVRIEEIIAPSYRLFPDSKPVDRVRESLKTYQVYKMKSWAETGVEPDFNADRSDAC